LVSGIVVLLTAVLVFLISGMGVLGELILTVLLISASLFCFLFLGLYHGLAIKDHHVPESWKNIYQGKIRGKLKEGGWNLGTFDVPSLGAMDNEACTVVLWIIVTILVILLIIALAAALIWSIFFLMFVLYWLFYRAYRQVFRHAFRCQGNARESMRYALRYTALYTGWLLGILLFIELGVDLYDLLG
jgi:hypothetical protein